MAAGRVKFFIADKGYGFIEPEAGGPDIFLHIKDLRKAGIHNVREGEALTFDTEPGRDGKGPKAIKIEVVR